MFSFATGQCHNKAYGLIYKLIPSSVQLGNFGICSAQDGGDSTSMCPSAEQSVSQVESGILEMIQPFLSLVGAISSTKERLYIICTEVGLATICL